MLQSPVNAIARHSHYEMMGGPFSQGFSGASGRIPVTFVAFDPFAKSRPLK
jgi:hypothetical protein